MPHPPLCFINSEFVQVFLKIELYLIQTILRQRFIPLPVCFSPGLLHTFGEKAIFIRVV